MKIVLWVGSIPAESQSITISLLFARISPVVAVITGQGMPIGYKIETLVTPVVLKLDPILQGAVQVPKMKLSRGAHTAQNSF